MESQVIAIYNKGLLNKKLLDALMEPFKDSDIDSGGSRNLKAKDGKSVEEIICFIMEPEKYQDAINPHSNDLYNEKLDDLWIEFARREWGFW